MNLLIDARKENETAKKYVYRILKQNIIQLNLEPGSTINENELSGELQLSRTPIREALQQLKEESRIIEIYPQKAMKVALIDLRLVEEVRTLRLLMEREMVKQLCLHAQEAHVLEVLRENVLQQEIFLAAGNRQKILALDNELHRQLFLLNDCELMYTVLQGVMIHYDRVRALEATLENHRKTVEDHRALLEAIAVQDSRKALKILDHHLGRWNLNKKTVMTKYPQYFKER